MGARKTFEQCGLLSDRRRRPYLARTKARFIFSRQYIPVTLCQYNHARVFSSACKTPAQARRVIGKSYVSRLISRKTLETFFVVGSRSPRRLRCECFTIVCDSQSHALFSECRPGVHEPDEHPDEARLTQRDRKDAALKESSSQSTVMG